MSNKPSIYANCKAGCSWETVHKDDFLRSAAFIRQNVTDNGSFKEFYLEAGQTVILKGDIEDSTPSLWKVTYEIRDVNNNVYEGPYPIMRSQFDTYLRIKHCGTQKESDGTYTLYYEMLQITYDSSTGTFSTSLYHTHKNLPDSQIVIRLMNVDEVYLVNEEAKIIGEGLPDVSSEDDGKVLMVDGGVWSAVTVFNAEEVSV